MEMKEAKELCICRGCPSYKECKEKMAYCFIGKSKCIKEDRGCICGSCPVHEKAKMKHHDFCFKGSEKQQK